VPGRAQVRCDRAAWEAAIGAHLERLGRELEPLPAREPREEAEGPTTTELRGEPSAGELSERPYVIADVRVPIAPAGHGSEPPFGPYPERADAETERRLLALLRLEADAVLIGAGTLRRRRHARPLGDRGLRERRRGMGLARDPLGVVVARSGEPPLDAPAFADGDAEVALFTAAAEPAPVCPAHVHIIRVPPGDLTPDVVMRRLRTDFGIRVLLYEGGPAMLSALAASGALDEVMVTACCAAPEAPPPADRLQDRPPLRTLVETRPLWELAGDARRLVRFRARRAEG
jgi:riboflavin biosynthesis pyrimidine reductase